MLFDCVYSISRRNAAGRLRTPVEAKILRRAVVSRCGRTRRSHFPYLFPFLASHSAGTGRLRGARGRGQQAKPASRAPTAPRHMRPWAEAEERANGGNAVRAALCRGSLFTVAGRLASFRALRSAEEAAAAARLSSSSASAGNRIEPEYGRCQCMAAAVAMSLSGALLPTSERLFPRRRCGPVGDSRR